MRPPISFNAQAERAIGVLAGILAEETNMDHIHYQEQASQFIDMELEDQDATSLFSHLSVCPECREFLKESLQLRSRMAHSVVSTLPQGVASLEWATIANNKSRKLSHISLNSSAQRKTAGPLPAIVFLLFMFVVGGLLFSTRIEIQRPQEYVGSTNSNVSQVGNLSR